jgi:hypothetical protein
MIPRNVPVKGRTQPALPDASTEPIRSRALTTRLAMTDAANPSSPGSRAFRHVRRAREGATVPKIASPAMPSACAVGGRRGGNIPRPTADDRSCRRIAQARQHPLDAAHRLQLRRAADGPLGRDFRRLRASGAITVGAPKRRAQPRRGGPTAPHGAIGKLVRRPASLVVRVTRKRDRAPSGGWYSACPRQRSPGRQARQGVARSSAPSGGETRPR